MKSAAQYKNPSRIIGIQFGMSSPEEIRKAGVVEVVSKDTYINNKEVPGGLFDPRMGVLGPGSICPTDGLTYIQTPGYFGYIEMARPVFFIQHIKEIMKILKCVCFKCSKLLISKEQHTQVYQLNSYHRWDYVYPLCQKVKRCGELTENGCGCKQPDKIKLDGMSTINAIWENLVNEGAGPASATAAAVATESKDGKSNYTMKLTAEIVLKIFKRISDEDVEFMGFSATWSRPDWMICQVLPVAPPAVRPSVKMDANQRSEDDLTHIYGHIIKTNKDLMERINANASQYIIDNLTMVLQYFVAMIVNNKVKGAVPVAHRTGRPLQCITGRLNSKNGRIRGNLMGKRVDFSARSVITGDPNLSARQLGVPLRVAMCLTKPVVVNDRNRSFLIKLVQNGPEVYPGAKILEKKDGSNVSLRYVDRTSIRLENGDIVHRHMMDGDAVLFNRQPSLHRMSMMCHIVKVMKRGDTFRMNVCDTKPYNADFDGDEMNMHMPQSELSETELRNLAAIPYQIISPSSNAPIIGIFQDSMLGSYQFTRQGVEFTPRQAMNILMGYSNIDMKELRNKKKITNFDILSQITPPISLKYKTKLFDDAEDPNVSNNVLEIHNGKYIRGQADKGVFASGTKGILNRICNDFGNMACSNYIDDLQQVITEYMKTSAYSVGVSDLVSDRKTTESVLQVISSKMNEVAELTDKIHLGILENNSGRTNAQEFEIQVGNILNDATSQTGKIGVKSLDESNRFVKIVKSGSKGSMLNISQMISCLGQQSVDGKRVPYGFDNRTLPHFKKFDDSPEARGFVKNSYISGLTAPELFFHAMGGRMGLIDTAVKSVTWETPIVFIDELGKPVYTEIGRWIDGKLDANSEAVQHFDEKNMELLNVNNIYVPTTDENGIVTWAEVTAMTRHDPGTTLYEIKTLGGRSVTVTESKSLLIWDAEKKGFYEMLTPDIRVGDCVPVTMDLPEPPVVIEKSEEDAIAMATDFYKGHIENLPSEIVAYPRKFLISFFQILETLGMKECSYDARNEYNANILAMLYNRIGYKVSFHGCVITIHVPKTDEYKNNVVLDPIVEIVPIGVEKHPKMYDLTIPTTLNFGLANGLQVRDTSQTGYIQRRLVKGLEDLKVEYDGTVRNNMGKIVQFTYGEDGVDTTRVENQNIGLVNMSIEDIYMYYDLVGLNEGENKDMLHIYTKETIKRFKTQRDKTKTKCKFYVDELIKFRDELVINVFHYKNEDAIKAPVAFQYIIQNIQGQMNLTATSAVDITPLEFIETIEKTFAKLKSMFKVTRLFEIMFFYSLSPKEVLIKKRFNTRAVAVLMEHIVLAYKKSVVHPGEMVGVIAGQSIGEPTTQLTLNSFVFETEILVRNSAGEIKCVQIGDFTKSGIEKSRKLDYMEDKDTTYAELSEFYEVPSATEDGKTVWRRVEAVTKHPVINEDGTNTMLKITTKGCRELIATKAKSFLKLVDGKIVGVEGKDLSVGDYLPVSKKPLDFTEMKQLDLRDILPPNEYIYGTEMLKAKSVVHEHQWWSKHSGKTFVLPYTRSDSAYCALVRPSTSVVYHPGFVYTKTNSICEYKIPEFIEMDYDFGYLVGAYCAEGCMTSHQISIANNDDEYLKRIETWCAKHNLTTKVYTQRDKVQDGWTSQDIRIYSTILCNVLKNLCGKLSHNKYVSDKIMFSNHECILGFLDAYIGGDGCVKLNKNRIENIEVTSVSFRLLTCVQLMLKNLGILSKINKPKLIESNNLGSVDIKQAYVLTVRNDQSIKLAKMLRLPVKSKRDRIAQLLDQTFKYEYCKFDLTVPNTVDGVLMMEPRDGRCADLEFDKILSIEEVENTTAYAYDLTVEDTRNFDCANGLCVRDTFHLAGVATKSNVTRGVPRIEEILRLTRNPDKPSATVFLKPADQHDKDKAANYCNMIQHTKLVDVVKSVEICFDPNDFDTKFAGDKFAIEEFYEFEKLFEECNEGADENVPRSKWIIRIEIDAVSLLDKNITMDDIHFAISNGHKSEVSCVFSDMNSNTLLFRIRLNSSVFKKKKGAVESLDQSDEIYLLKHFQDNLLNNVVLRGVNNITNVNPRMVKDMVVKEDSKYVRKDIWLLDTVGSNLLDIFPLDFIDYTRTYSNDIREVYDVLGIEAARQNILNEFNEVMEASDAYVNYHHLSILCDRMTVKAEMVPMFRSGIINDDIGPISKSTYEMHTEIFLDASRHGDFDQMRGVSANVMCGQAGFYGTNAFSLLLDMKAILQLEEKELAVQKAIDFGFVQEDDTAMKIDIDNNVRNIQSMDIGKTDDDYSLF